MLLWVTLACLTAIVVLVLVTPLAGERGGKRPRAGFDAAVYRDQLGEVESDRERGLIGEAEAEAARLEIARRLLATDARERTPNPKQSHVPTRAVIVAVAVMLPALALGLYLTYGAPSLHDQPLAARLDDPASDQNLDVLVARVEARLRENPEEGEGWDVVAPVYMAWQRYGDAAEAYSQAIRLLGETPKRLAGRGQALVLANDGIVSEEARAALERALVLDPELVQPRILLAVAKEQDGKIQEAIEAWHALLANAAADAPWRKTVEQRLAQDEARLAGKSPEPSTEPAQPGQGGPNAEDVAAAKRMSPAGRQAMIETMVQGLAAKLDANGDDLAGWLKLVRAYSVLDRKQDALAALAKAKTSFTGNADALNQLDQLAAELGLKS